MVKTIKTTNEVHYLLKLQAIKENRTIKELLELLIKTHIKDYNKNLREQRRRATK